MIDFDGALASYDGNFRADILGRPHPRALEAVDSYVKAGFRIVVYTTRAKDREGMLRVRDWLALNGFDALVPTGDPIYVTAFKVPAVAYIDDRAWRFSGHWPSAAELDQFKPWWDKG
jgi:hypothetical protein